LHILPFLVRIPRFLGARSKRYSDFGIEMIYFCAVQVSKKDIKLVRSLGQKKFRNETGLFIAEGLKLCREAIASKWDIHSIYTTDEAFLDEASDAIKVTSAEMKMISQLTTPSPYLCVIHQQEAHMDLSTKPLLCVMDGVSDPGNLGTMIRTADWFGIRHILCSTDCVESTNPKVVQSTMGSIFRVQVAYLPTSELIHRVQQAGYTLSGAVLDGTTMFDCQLTSDHALVIGSESHGISSEMQQALKLKITIPGVPGAESLNASVAAGILMSEFHRQRNSPL
jgi:TrmH family RNA methyltransferase